jgi:hypothetical protein
MIARKKEGYVHVGDVLRDALIEDIDAIDWEDRQAQADKIKISLQIAAPHRGGYLLNTDEWTWSDINFLRDAISSVEEDEGHSFGGSIGNTRIGRQIRALREKL